jgi:hypothetical protein
MSSISQFQLEQMQARLARNRHEPEAPPALEKDLHQDIMDYCDRQWPRWKYVHSRTDKATRNEPGVPDFLIILPAQRVLLVECKRPGEKVSPAQRDWHAEAAKLDHIVCIVHDMQEFGTAIEFTNQKDHQ